MTTWSLPFGAVAHVYSPGDHDAFFEWLGRPRACLAVDVETEGLGRGDATRTVQFGDREEAWVLQAQRDRDVVVRVMTTTALRFVGWNTGFDAGHLSRLTGLPLTDVLARMVDTSVMAGVVDPRASYQGGVGGSLDDWSVHLLGADASGPDRDLDALFLANSWGSKRSKACRGWVEVPLDHPTYLRYAAMDTVTCSRVHEALVARVRADGPVRVGAVVREQQVGRIVSTIRDKGLLLDREHTEGVRVHYATRLADLSTTLAGLGVTKIGSTAQLAKRLEEEGLGDLIGVTERLHVSVDKSVLKAAGAKGSEAAPLVVAARLAKRYSRDYAERYLGMAADDGRVRPGLRSIGTRTRRMTCSNPNLQQVPAEKPKPGRPVPRWAVRSCFVPEEGHVILRADYASMELRYAAAISGDPRLMEEVRADGFDMFLTMAEQVWPGRGHAMRQVAKIVVYATLYGAGARTLASITGLTEPEARRMRDTFLRRYPVLRAASSRAANRVRATGGVELPLSGFLPCSRDRGYVGMNLMVQGGCRDLFAERLVAMDAAGLGPWMRLPLHDEMVLSVPEEHLADARGVMLGTMPVPATPDLPVPIPVDTSTGRSWGDAYSGEAA